MPMRATAIAVRRNARTLRRGCTGGSFRETTVATEQRSGEFNYSKPRQGLVKERQCKSARARPRRACPRRGGSSRKNSFGACSCSSPVENEKSRVFRPRISLEERPPPAACRRSARAAARGPGRRVRERRGRRLDGRVVGGDARTPAPRPARPRRVTSTPGGHVARRCACDRRRRPRPGPGRARAGT